MACSECNQNTCCCPKVISVTGTQGKQGNPGPPGVGGRSILYQGEFDTPPSSPQDGWFYHDTTLHAARTFSGRSWGNFVLDGTNGTNGTDGTNGTNGTNGVSATYTGDVTSLPGSPSVNQVVRLTTATPPQSEVWTGSVWHIVAKDGVAGTNGTNGTNGAAGTDGTNGVDGTNGTNGTNGRDGNGFLFASLNITSLQIKSLNSAPLEIVASSLNGFAIEVISASASYSYGTVAYVGGSKIYLKTSTATLQQVETFAGFVTLTSSKFCKMTIPTPNNIQIVNQQNLVVTADADSTLGDGTCTIYVCYRLITL